MYTKGDGRGGALVEAAQHANDCFLDIDVASNCSLRRLHAELPQRHRGRHRRRERRWR